MIILEIKIRQKIITANLTGFILQIEIVLFHVYCKTKNGQYLLLEVMCIVGISKLMEKSNT